MGGPQRSPCAIPQLEVLQAPATLDALEEQLTKFIDAPKKGKKGAKKGKKKGDPCDLRELTFHVKLGPDRCPN